jgi:hypothetical protein
MMLGNKSTPLSMKAIVLCCASSSVLQALIQTGFVFYGKDSNGLLPNFMMTVFSGFSVLLAWLSVLSIFLFAPSIVFLALTGKRKLALSIILINYIFGGLMFFINEGFTAGSGGLWVESVAVYERQPLLLWMNVLPLILLHVLYFSAFIVESNPEVRLRLVKRLKGV